LNRNKFVTVHMTLKNLFLIEKEGPEIVC